MDDEDEIIKFYFERKYEYKTILLFLEKYHGIKISRGTLLNKLSALGLRRRELNVDEDAVRHIILRELQGPGRLLGYRPMWRKLHQKYGINVPRYAVQYLLRELNPEGSRLRQARRLKRRDYLNPGPNFCWHSDGYDKLKPYGFPVHGCIDGFSRRVMWLKVTRSNNDPSVVGRFFLECVVETGACPTLVRTDRGTENGTMATIQCFLRRNHHDQLSGIKAHRYGSSHSNQRIEAWWSQLKSSWSSWWIDFFKDLIDQGQLDTSNKLQMECVWFCFHTIIQNELNEAKDNWNSHHIRKSRNHTPSGIPNKLYFLPETIGCNDYKHAFDIADIEEVGIELNAFSVDDGNESSDYQNYFQYAMQMLGIREPTSWQDGLSMYNRLLAVAEYV